MSETINLLLKAKFDDLLPKLREIYGDVEYRHYSDEDEIECNKRMEMSGCVSLIKRLQKGKITFLVNLEEISECYGVDFDAPNRHSISKKIIGFLEEELK